MARILAFLTTTNLAANGVYTGGWVRIAAEPGLPTDTDIQMRFEKRRLRLIAWSNVGSAVGGLAVQFSVDGTTAIPGPTATVVANVPFYFDVQLFGQFVRPVYTNGAVGQAFFVLAGWLEEDV